MLCITPDEDLTEEIKSKLIPSQLRPTEKAKQRLREMYGNTFGIEKFLSGIAPNFVLRDARDRIVVIDWSVFYGTLSYQEIWELVRDEFDVAIKKEEAWDIENEFDMLFADNI